MAVRASIFLSASVPDPSRDQRYASCADVVAIGEAVRALAAVVLPAGRLVFGGHPAIAPFVRMISVALKAESRVGVYQSEFFRTQIPPAGQSFKDIAWTPAVAGDREGSLRLMREEMIRSEAFAAGVFIGGMEGVEEEWRMFCAIHGGVPALPVASTGAAALLLLQGNQGPQDPVIRQRLCSDYVYASLFQDLLQPLLVPIPARPQMP